MSEEEQDRQERDSEHRMAQKPDLSDYKSEDKTEVAKTRITYTEVKPKEISDTED